jgi:hypothetical protein
LYDDASFFLLGRQLVHGNTSNAITITTVDTAAAAAVDAMHPDCDGVLRRGNHDSQRVDQRTTLFWRRRLHV